SPPRRSGRSRRACCSVPTGSRSPPGRPPTGPARCGCWSPRGTSRRPRRGRRAARAPRRGGSPAARRNCPPGGKLRARWPRRRAGRKAPAGLAAEAARAAAASGLTVRVREPAELAAEGFGGILAVGAGSAQPPCLIELGYHPPGARTHVVLVGKGITFDSGGL